MRSGDPVGKAFEIANKLKAERFGWCCLQLHPGDSQQPNNILAAQWLKTACDAKGIRYGTWCQGQPYEWEAANVSSYGATFHIANVESRHEERTFDVADFRRRYPKMEAAVIFTQTAFDDPPGVPSKALAKRWIQAGFNALPEANEAENFGLRNPPGGFVHMQFLAQQLGWPIAAPTAFVLDGYAASHYTNISRYWSIWRYAGMKVEGGRDDWAVVRSWPR